MGHLQVTSVRLPYIHRFSDRHGRVRHYYRRPGQPTVMLPGTPGSPEFLLAYSNAARNAKVASVKIAPVGSVNELIESYLRAEHFGSLKKSTQTVYRNVIRFLRQEFGSFPLRGINARAIRIVVGKKGTTPAAANRMLSILRILMAHGIQEGLIDIDPTQGVKRLPEARGGFHSWTEAEIARYERHYPIGTPARLAFDLLLYTGQRRSDVVRMGPQTLRDGRLDFQQQKTGMDMSLPVHPTLRATIAASTTGLTSFLVTSHGKPFVAAGFGNWFRARCDEAGLPKCSAHGLRKAAARRLAEAGCSVHEIASVTGHATLAEVQRYAKGADQARLSDGAFTRLNGKP